VDGGLADIWTRQPHKPEDLGKDFSSDEFEVNERLNCSRFDFEHMVMQVRNDERFDRKNWLAMIAGIKHQLGEDGKNLAEKWSASWTGGEHDQREFTKAWHSLKGKKPGGATAKTVLKFAMRDGWVKASDSEEDRFAVYGDLWNGTQFARDHKGRLLYVESLGNWYVKRGPRFVPSTLAEVDQAAKATSKRLLELAFAKVASDPSDATKKLFNKAIALQTSLPAIRKMIDAAKSEPGMSIASPDHFDKDPYALLVENGVLDLKTGTLREPHSGELFAKQAGTAFDPLATCPKFDAFLMQVQPEAHTRAYIQRAVGYTLLGLPDEEVMFFVTGFGANGKSVLANILSALFGDYCRVVSSSLLTKSRYDSEAERQKIALIGTRLALMNETSKNDVWDDQRVKELVSREKMTVRMLYHEAFDVTPTHTFWVRSNHSPGAQDGGDGFWRRIELLPFQVQLERDAQILDLDRQIVSSELPGILNWSLAGCLAWQSERLKTPKHLEALKSEYRGETDLVGQWLVEATLSDPTARTSIADAYASYRTFCEYEGHRYIEVKAQFTRQMTTKGFQRARGTAVRKFVGFKLKSNGQGGEF
jgi:putative DNA primase/helicase